MIIDFSNPALLDDLLTYSAAKSMPLVIATTGYTAEQKAKIEAAAEKCPIFFTYNMSMGINLLATLAQKAVNVLARQARKAHPGRDRHSCCTRRHHCRRA